jgi:hypothetical protein
MNEPKEAHGYPSAHITMTIDIGLLRQIDEMRGRCPRCPRSEWLRQAAEERIERLEREPVENGGAS